MLSLVKWTKTTKQMNWTGKVRMKSSPCCSLSFGWFPGFWILCADVSEHSVISIFIGCVSITTYEVGNDAGESPKRKNTTFRTRRKFEINAVPQNLHAESQKTKKKNCQNRYYANQESNLGLPEYEAWVQITWRRILNPTFLITCYCFHVKYWSSPGSLLQRIS